MGSGIFTSSPRSEKRVPFSKGEYEIKSANVKSLLFILLLKAPHSEKTTGLSESTFFKVRASPWRILFSTINSIESTKFWLIESLKSFL